MTSDAGRITYKNVTLRDCLTVAFDVKDYQISGPAWMATDRFDIVATMGGSNSVGADPADDLPVMLQNLLMDRFQMAIHRETRELSVYSMVVGKNGAKVGQSPTPDSANQGKSSMRISGGGVLFRNVTMQDLVDYMSHMPLAEIDRPVIDDTGLKGRYDFDVNLFGTREEMMAAVSKGDLGASVFTLIQEQLGLKLEPRKAPIDMVVVDKAERVPTDN
jgi:uncharacterized protein (TIGR03435 family)